MRGCADAHAPCHLDLLTPSANPSTPQPPGEAAAPLALDIAGLHKAFNGKPVVMGVDLRIARGEFHALLGPNGAGKSSTLRMVAGLLRPDAGSIHVYGHDVQAQPIAAKRAMAFMPDDPLLYGKLSALETLVFVAGLWAMSPAMATPRAEMLLHDFGLPANPRERVETFSRGQRQKLALACALIHDPSLMILDEPLTGLDAAAARQVKDLLRARAQAGCAIVLTTHILEIAQRLADRISIIAGGRIVAQGTLAELQALAVIRGGQHSDSEAAAADRTLEDVFLALTAPAQ